MLRRAVADGARIHVDNFEEIDSSLEIVARELGRPIDVAIRVNLDAGIHPVWSKFGFNLENGQAMSAVRRIHAGGLLRVDGLHCHIGTFVLDPSAYARAVAKLAPFGREAEALLTGVPHPPRSISAAVSLRAAASRASTSLRKSPCRR